MKKNSMSTAICAGVAGVAGLVGMANAVNLNPDGLGQVMLYPYFTVNGGNTTLLSVVNTTDQAKAVKVRFLESLNSAEVLDFNLYMSPFDVWTARLSQTATGASIFTDDTTCTVPNLVGKDNGGQFSQFRPFEFESNSPDIIGELGQLRLGGAGGALTAISSAERMRQGHVEVIEMGVLLNEVAPSTFTPRSWSIHAGAAGARLPNNCAALQAAWSINPSGQWTADRGRAINAPSGGLFGGAAIVDVAFGRALTYNSDAIDGFWNPVGIPAEANGTTADLHREPGDTAPSLANARTNADDSATAIVFDNGAIATATFNDGLSAVSAALMARFIYNEFNLESSLAAASEWVITFPTKRGHTYVDGAGQALPGVDVRPFSDGVDVEPVAAHRDGRPFDTYGLCERINIRWWDREERTPGPGAVGTDISPRPPTDAPIFPQLCWESNILAFNQPLDTAETATSIFGATPKQGAHGLNIGAFSSGWMRLEFNDPIAPANTFRNYLLSDDVNVRGIVGLPVIGFWAADYTNSAVGAGVRANFSQISDHRLDRDGYLLGGAASPAFGTNLNRTGLATWTAATSN